MRPPKHKKRGVTRAMLLHLYATLDVEHDQDDAVFWAGITLAFHFMARSAEWTAKGANGSFLLDKVVLIRNVTFFKDGRPTPNADEVRVVFGKTKQGGGELRCTYAAGN